MSNVFATVSHMISSLSSMANVSKNPTLKLTFANKADMERFKALIHQEVSQQLIHKGGTTPIRPDDISKITMNGIDWEITSAA